MKGFLKCDAQGCDYHTPDQFELTADMIGTPCPKCGANLLTEEDYRAAKRMERVLRFFAFFGLVKEVKEGAPPPPKTKQVTWGVHQNKVTFKETDV